MELLRTLNEQGKTIIMVTHEPDIAAYAENRLHMIDGVIDRIETGAHEADEDRQEYLARH
jgi:putative ABC transport system ATP-binding protein